MTTSVGWGFGSSGVNPSEVTHAQQEETLGRIHRGMAVYNVQGHRIGSVGGVLRAPGDRAFAVVVRTGWFGLGKELYIPLQYVNVWGNQVSLSVDRHVIHRMGWDKRPAYLEKPVTEPTVEEHGAPAKA